MLLASAAIVGVPRILDGGSARAGSLQVATLLSNASSMRLCLVVADADAERATAAGAFGPSLPGSFNAWNALLVPSDVGRAAFDRKFGRWVPSRADHCDARPSNGTCVPARV